MSRPRKSSPETLAAWLQATPPARFQATSPAYRFADRYTVPGVFSNPRVARAFVDDYLSWEAHYFEQARNPRTGLTYDGLQLDASGKPQSVRQWSAPSKESLDIGMCLKALTGNPLALKVVGSQQKAVEILGKKLHAYRDWYRRCPGYGGYLPWFVSGDHLKPTDDWAGDVPGLDNGEWVWSMRLAEKLLRDHGYTRLAQGYADYNRLLASKVVEMFYDPVARKVRGDVHVVDPSDAGSRYQTIHDKPGRMTYLSGPNGVYEGMMMDMYLSLYGQGLPDGAVKQIWDGISMKRVEHPDGTTWQAFWGSAHEEWPYLFLPLRDMEGYRELFRLREVIRTQNAAQRGYPGFASSTNNPRGPGYLDGAGIEGISSQPIRNNDTFAIYGAFPLLLQCSDNPDSRHNYGLAWLLNMLKGPGQQGPLGGGESGTNDGHYAAHLKTMDGTFPNLLAMSGGLEHETASMMAEQGVYGRFRQIMQNQYDKAFGSVPLRQPVDLTLPTASVPHPKNAESPKKG